MYSFPSFFTKTFDISIFSRIHLEFWNKPNLLNRVVLILVKLKKKYFSGIYLKRVKKILIVMFLVVMEIVFSEGQLNFNLKCEHRTN